MNQGIYDISIDQYHNGAGVSRSGIQEFKKSPLHYWHEYLRPDQPLEERPEIITAANPKEFGNVFHTYLLEPEKFEQSYRVIDKVDRRTTVGKKALEDAKITAAGRFLVCGQSFEEVISMHRSIHSSATAKGLIDGALYEKSLFWTDKDTGILCKVRPDIWHNNMVVDIKTSKNASMRTFQQDLYSYGYHLQAAMIHEALFALKGINMMNFIFVVVEKEAPYAVAVYQLNEQAVLHGIQEFKKILFEMKDCMANNSWPSYPDAIIDLPMYAYNKQGDL